MELTLCCSLTRRASAAGLRYRGAPYATTASSWHTCCRMSVRQAAPALSGITFSAPDVEPGGCPEPRGTCWSAHERPGPGVLAHEVQTTDTSTVCILARPRVRVSRAVSPGRGRRSREAPTYRGSPARQEVRWPRRGRGGSGPRPGGASRAIAAAAASAEGRGDREVAELVSDEEQPRRINSELTGCRAHYAVLRDTGPRATLQRGSRLHRAPVLRDERDAKDAVDEDVRVAELQCLRSSGPPAVRPDDVRATDQACRRPARVADGPWLVLDDGLREDRQGPSSGTPHQRGVSSRMR